MRLLVARLWLGAIGFAGAAESSVGIGAPTSELHQAAPPALVTTTIVPTPPSSTGEVVYRQIPVGGSVLIYLDSLSSEATLPTAGVVGPDGTARSGVMVTLAGSYYAWRPAQPLEEGAFRIEIFAGQVLVEQFYVVPSSPLAERVELKGEWGMQQGTTTFVCCKDSISGSAVGPCAPSVVPHYAVFSPMLHEAPSVNWFQYLWRAPGSGAEWSLFDPVSILSFSPSEMPRSEYCQAMEGLPVGAGPSIVVRRCAPTLPPTLPYEERPDTAYAFDLDRCAAPPAGEETRWCEHNAVACADPTRQECASYGPACLGWPAPLPQEPGESTNPEGAAPTGSPSSTVPDQESIPPPEADAPVLTSTPPESLSATAPPRLPSAEHCSIANNVNAPLRNLWWLIGVVAILVRRSERL